MYVVQCLTETVNMSTCGRNLQDTLRFIGMSLESSVGIFEGNWYKQKKGVPTGGSLCVQLARVVMQSEFSPFPGFGCTKTEDGRAQTKRKRGD